MNSKTLILTNQNKNKKIDYNLIDYFLLDSYKKIEKFKKLEECPWGKDIIYLFFEDENKIIRQNTFYKKDFKDSYVFIIINNEENFKSVGFLLPKERKNEINNILLNEIDKRLHDIKKILRINLEKNNYNIFLKENLNTNYYNYRIFKIEKKVSKDKNSNIINKTIEIDKTKDKSKLNNENIYNINNYNGNNYINNNNTNNINLIVNNNINNNNIYNKPNNFINGNYQNNNIINNQNSSNFINNINYNNNYNFMNNNIQKNNQNINNQNNMTNQNSQEYIFLTRGLQNIGSTCYMNATLQCLLHVSELILYFLKEYKKDYDLLRKKNKNVESLGEISEAFYGLLKGIYEDSNINSLNPKTYNVKGRYFLDKKAFTPSEFKRVVGFHNPQFQKFKANDSKDLILYLFQTMHEELNYFGDIPQSRLSFPNQFDRVNAFFYFINTYNYHNFSIISSIFYGTYENTTYCLNCRKTIYNFQKFEFLSFGMCDYHKKDFNIFQGFNDNQKPQKLSGDNKFYCNNCHGLKDATITSKIIQPPNKLLINIDYGKNKKFKPSKIIFDEIIDITKYVNFNFGIEIKYQIISVCSHFGHSGSFGHYIAFCRNRETKKWYKFNDSSCDECNKEEIYTGSPYLLLYEKI